MKFRKKPVVIEAMQFNHVDDYLKIAKFASASSITLQFTDDFDFRLMIPTLEGDMPAYKGDWIIKGIAGEFYPCKPDIFEMTYEPVE